MGRRIRRLRAAGRLTLNDLAQRAAVSRAMLSRIERGESSPTAQLLVRVCNGLGITLSMFFAPAEGPASPLARHADQPVWRDPASGYSRRSVSPARTGSPVEIVAIDFPAGASVTLDGLPIAGADQHVWLLAGAMDIMVGDRVVRLAAGDCLHMRFDRPIHFSNPTTDTARYAVVISRGGVQP